MFLNRCSPKHYLPVLSVYRPDKDAKELGTHVYPKVPSSGANACWITFLGAHGHCEKHSQKYDLYNTADESHANSKEDCLARAKWWMDYCDTPEYRKSLHLQGEEKEAILAKLRQRLGMSGKASKVSNDVKHHTGVDTGPNEEVKSEPVMNPSYEEKKPEEYT